MQLVGEEPRVSDAPVTLRERLRAISVCREVTRMVWIDREQIAAVNGWVDEALAAIVSNESRVTNCRNARRALVLC